MAVKGRLLPVPNLDDRDWRAIKDAMILKVPERCPEWTDVNLSDPGVTLAEVFALEIEQLIYRLNQVLPKHMREYLNMIGVTLTPPSVARAMIFFKLASPQTFDVVVREGFEVATAAVAGEERVIFTTDEDLVIYAAKLHRCFGYQDGDFSDFTEEANDESSVFDPLSDPLSEEDILYLAHQEDNYFEKIVVTVETPRDGAVSGVWEYYRANPDNTYEWATLDVEDGTDTFAQSGEITFTIPADWEPTRVNDIQATWLRFRITSVEAGAVFATVRRLRMDEIHGRVLASNASMIDEETLGSSDSTRDQRFYLSNVPVLDMIVLVDEGLGFQEWHEVDDFSMSGPEDKHYVLNHATGEVLFGDGRKGMIPASGTDNLKAAPYRFGGGTRGNVGAQTITSLRSSHVYLDSCVNKEPAKGGGNEETVEQAIERGPTEQLKTRNRAVTDEDFITLTLESSTGIARAKTLPLFDPAHPEEETPGVVAVIAMPKGGGTLGLPLRTAVREYLDKRRLVTTQLYVIDPNYVTVTVHATVVKTETASAPDLQDRLESALCEFLDPEYGGDTAKAERYVEGLTTERGEGWDFGKNVYRSELFELMERIDGVDHVESIEEPMDAITIERNQLPVSGEHLITVI